MSITLNNLLRLVFSVSHLFIGWWKGIKSTAHILLYKNPSPRTPNPIGFGGVL